MTPSYATTAPGARILSAALIMLALAAACGPAAPSPTAAPPPAAPASTQTGSGAADWEQQWNALVAAAQKEGKVVVFGPPTPEMRTMLPEAFKKRFGIEMEYNGIAGGEYSARLASERAAGVYSADAVINGSDSMFRVVAAEGKVTDGVMGMLAPLRPALLLPEVLDPTKYRTGKLWFDDPPGEYILRIANFVAGNVELNTRVVPQATVTSWQDLLKPEYKGKIAGYDPTVAGAGLALASYLYVTFGDDYVRRLYIGQDVFLTRDHRQLGDLLVRGSHPITLALQTQESARLQREGHPVVDLSGFTDGAGYIAAGYGLLGLMDKAPHPNAAQVFVNWAASREGAQVIQEGNRQLSTRNDVDISSFPETDMPKAGVNYLDTYDWDYVLDKRVKAQADLREVLGRRGS
jgi:iron(III) transport system substrate-binding protein